MADQEEIEEEVPTSNEKKEKKKKKKSKEKSRENQLIEKMETILPSFIKQIDDPRWKFERETKGVEISRLIEEGDPIHKVKGRSIVRNCNVQQMLDALRKFPECYEISDPMYMSGSIPVSLGENSKIYDCTFRMPGRPLVSDRNFVWVTLERLVDANSGISLAATLECNDIYPYPQLGLNVVRGELKESGYYFKKVEGEENAVELIYVVQVDVKGWLPIWVINMAAGDQAMNVCRIREYFGGLVHKGETSENQEKEEESNQEGENQSGKKKKKKKKKNKKKNQQNENQEEKSNQV